MPQDQGDIGLTGTIPVYFSGERGEKIETALRSIAHNERRRVNDQVLLMLEKQLQAEGYING